MLRTSATTLTVCAAIFLAHIGPAAAQIVTYSYKGPAWHTILSMSVSLVAVFIPLLLMSGVIGLMFQEFAVTVSAAIAVSAPVSLTLTPTMCAYLLKPSSEEKAGPPPSQSGFAASQ